MGDGQPARTKLHLYNGQWREQMGIYTMMAQHSGVKLPERSSTAKLYSWTGLTY